MIDWRALLRHWSIELMGSDLADQVEPPPTAPDWLGYEPASDEDISKLEGRLGLWLPPSYKAFLGTSNGWRRTTSFIGRMRPAAEVDWFRVENEDWVEAYAELDDDRPDGEFYAYPNGSAPGHRAAHMRHLVQISDVDDGVCLLNPKAVTPDGEWEAWFFANWVPGAERYPSFAHLMVAQLRQHRELGNVASTGWTLPSPPVPPPRVRRKAAKKVVRPKAVKQPPLTVDELLVMLESPDKAVRGRAVRTLAGKVGGHGSWAVPRPDLVEPLSSLFNRSDDPTVRAVCISALTEVAPDGKAPPPPLLAALSDPDPWVVLAGVFALPYFPDPRAVVLICRFIESGANALINEAAMSALGDLGDPAAVPTLVGVMTNTANPVDQSFGSAGLALGRIASPTAVDALIAGLDHADPRVRFAAVVGLIVSGDPRSPGLLDRMFNDADPKVSTRVRQQLGRINQ